MSWSASASGTPAEVKETIRKYREGYGQSTPERRNVSAEEFDEALPHLEALVDLHKGDGCEVSLEAYGHGTFDYSNGEPVCTRKEVTVHIKRVKG